MVLELRGDMIAQRGELRQSTMDHVFVFLWSPFPQSQLSLPYAFIRAENRCGSENVPLNLG